MNFHRAGHQAFALLATKLGRQSVHRSRGALWKACTALLYAKPVPLKILPPEACPSPLRILHAQGARQKLARSARSENRPNPRRARPFRPDSCQAPSHIRATSKAFTRTTGHSRQVLATRTLGVRPPSRMDTPRRLRPLPNRATLLG